MSPCWKRTCLCAVAAVLGARAMGSSFAARAANPAAGAAERKPALEVLLRPMKNPAGQISYLEIRLELTNPTATAEAPLSLHIPLTFAGISGIADSVENLSVRDAKGAIELQKSDDPPDAGGFIFWRRWKASRPVSGTVIVQYRSRLPEAHPRAGPPFDLRSNEGGVSGAGFGFLVLPEDEGVFQVRLQWDLKNLDPGSIGLTTMGEGNVDIEASLDVLHSSYYMAGRLGKFPSNGSTGRFHAVWVGMPPFDAREEMAWSEKAFTALREFFRDSSSDPFYFLMRAGADNDRIGGAGLTNSFLLFAPLDPEMVRGIRETIAHELVHHWIGEENQG